MKKKTELSKEEIIHLAKLANLSLTDEEIEKFRKQLTETVEYVENLNELDTKQVSETSSTAQLTDVFFKDGEENKRNLTQADALKNSKNKKNDYFVVKRIL